MLTTLLLTSCGADLNDVDIAVSAQYGEGKLNCDERTSDITLTDLRLFVYDLHLIGIDGSELPVSLVADDQWQTSNTALIDLEDGTGNCLNGTAGTNTLLRARYAGTAGKGLIFRIGVPETLNHANPLLAAPPLSDSAMHWHWTTGYKFMRAGVKTADDGFFLHLGSSRCERTVENGIRCRDSNRPEIRVVDFVPGDGLVIDLAVLFQGIDLHDGNAGRCMSGLTETECVPLLQNLGITHPGKRRDSAPLVRRAGS